MTWTTSSHSGSNPYGNCVEVRPLVGAELGEIGEQIDRIERVRPHLRDLGDVAAADRRLAGLRACRDALTGAGVPA